MPNACAGQKNFNDNTLINRIFFILFLVVAVSVACCPQSFAAQQTIPPSATLTVDGQNEGVAIIAPATLTVDGTGGFTNIGATAGSSVSTNAINQGVVLFSVSSVVTGDIGATVNTLDQVNADNGATTVDFNGTVFTRIMGVGTGTVNFNSGTLGAAGNKGAITFTGDGVINVAANTSFTGALNDAGAQTGTLNLFGAAAGIDQWTGAVGVAGMRSINVDNGSTAGVRSQITGAVDTYAFDLGTNRLDIIGTLNLRTGPAGAIYTTLGSSSVYGRIVETGANTFTGGVVTVVVTVPGTSFLAPGSLFDIVNDFGAGQGGVPVVVTSLNPLYTFTAAPTLAGLVQLQLAGVPLQVSPSPAVPALLAIPNPSPDLISVLAPINALTDPNAVLDAVAQLAPSTPSLAAPLVTFQEARESQGLWLSRLNMCRDASQSNDQSNEMNSACSDSQPHNGWWAKGFGYFGDQDARGSSTGYESQIYGGMIAYDAPINPDTRAGLAFGYAHSTIDGDKFDASTEFDSYRPLIYIGHENGPWYIHGSGSFGWHEYEDSRHILFPGVDRTAEADYSGQDYTVFADTGYHFFAQEFTITPLASLQYSHVDIDGYTETGARDVSLKVESQSYDFVESGLGVKLERPFTQGGNTYIPEVHFKWLHEFSDPTLEQTAAFTAAGSPSFTTQGQDADDDTLNVGAGFTLLSCACSAREWSIEGVYDYDWTGEGYSAHQGTIRFTNRF